MRKSAGPPTHCKESAVATAAEASMDALITSFGNFDPGKAAPEVSASVKQKASAPTVV